MKLGYKRYRMAQQQKVQKELKKIYLHELKLHGQQALDSLVQLSNKFNNKYRNSTDIKSILLSYKSIVSNLCLELKKREVTTIAKAFLSIFQGIADIVNAFMIGKLLPPTDVLINNQCWDVDAQLNFKIDKICEKTLENVDEIDSTTNKAEILLIEVVESLNRQLSAIHAVNFQDVHFINFEEMILEELEQMRQKGLQNQRLVEKGKGKLRTIILKILEAEDHLKRKLNIRKPGQIINRGTQTVQPLVLVAAELLRTGKNKPATQLEQKQTTLLNQSREILNTKLDNLRIVIMEKDLDISKLKNELQGSKQLIKITQDRLTKYYQQKIKEIISPIKHLQIHNKVIDIAFQIILSQKMIPIQQAKNTNKVSNELSKDISRQSLLITKPKPISKRQSSSNLQHFRHSRTLTTNMRHSRNSGYAQNKVNQTIQRIATQQKLETLIQYTMKDKQIFQPCTLLQNSKLKAIRTSMNQDKIYNNELDNYIKNKKWKTNNEAIMKNDVQRVKTAKIEFKIHTQDYSDYDPIMIIPNQKRESNFLTAVVKHKSKPTTIKTQNNEMSEAIKYKSIFVEEDLKLFGGIQGAEKFQLIKVKDVSRPFDERHYSPRPKLIHIHNQPTLQSKHIQNIIVQLYRFLRSTKRQYPNKYNRIINFLRFPYSYIKSYELDIWQVKEVENDLGSRELKGMIVKLLQIHKDCQDGRLSSFCSHFTSFFQKIGLNIK